MAKQRRASGMRTVPTRIPIFSLSSGVGRQAPSKRLPTEAQTIDNAFVTLERSICKRSGYEFVEGIANENIGGPYGAYNYDMGLTVSSSDLWFYWFDFSDTIRYLIIINYDFNSEDTNTTRLISIYKIENSTWMDISDGLGEITADIQAYLTYNPSSAATAKEALRAVTVGQNIIILNRFVKAGFSSDNAGGAADNTGSASPKFQLIPRETYPDNPYTGYNETTEYTTRSLHGDGLKVKVDTDGAGNLVRIQNNGIIDAGIGYRLNEIVTIIREDNPAQEAPFRLLDPVNNLYDLGGNITAIEDVKGRPIDYYTTIEQDPESEATEHDPNSNYLAGDFAITGTSYYDGDWPNGEWIPERKIYQAKKDVDTSSGPIPIPNTAYWTFKRLGKFLLVEDWVYPDVLKPEFGQSLASFSSISFPPLDTDMTANNGYTASGNDRTELTLRTLYPLIGSAQGKGKIYFCAGPYLAALPGYYRIISKNPDSGGEGRPYTQRVRTPDPHSYIDPLRMPKQLTVETTDSFSISHIQWDSRTSGTAESNPGPAIFKSSDGEKLQHVAINAMAFYRGRLFLAAADTIFSTRIGEYDNLWLADPGNITSADPIDLQASSNKYAKINALIPFSDFLFINTDSDTQFELLGSENQITPLTAELAPTSFYATSPLIDPILMGSQIYFTAPHKFFIYFSSQAANLNTAVEVSQHCPEYLPTEFTDLTVAGSRNTIFLGDKKNVNHLFVYTNRFSGDQVVQNAFHRWVLPNDVRIYSTSFDEDSLWLCLGIPYTDSEDVLHPDKYKLVLAKLIITDESLIIPRIDNRIKFTITDTNTTYDATTGQTTFILPVNYTNFNNVILHSGWESDNYTHINIASQSIVRVPDEDDGKCHLKVSGNYKTIGNIIYFGTSFKMDIQLSPIFVRDDNNNVRDGVLSLRTLHLRHFETGNYNVEVSRRGRPKNISRFNSQQLGEYGTTFPTDIYETQGEFLARIMAFSHEATINITSESSTPCNITNLEVKGKFKPTYSSLDK